MKWLLAILSRHRHLAAMRRFCAQQASRAREREQVIADLEADSAADRREIAVLRIEIEGLKMQVDGVVTAHERLLERNKAELALHRLRRISYESGNRPRDAEEETGE